jgi:transposase
MEALQHIRIQYRWEAMDAENQAIKDAKTQGRKYKVQRDKLESMVRENKRIRHKEINTVANTIENKMETTLNYFVNRNTNAESFNAKIKLFRANLRGVTDTKFFLFRLEKLFA